LAAAIPVIKSFLPLPISLSVKARLILTDSRRQPLPVRRLQHEARGIWRPALCDGTHDVSPLRVESRQIFLAVQVRRPGIHSQTFIARSNLGILTGSLVEGI